MRQFGRRLKKTISTLMQNDVEPNAESSINDDVQDDPVDWITSAANIDNVTEFPAVVTEVDADREELLMEAKADVFKKTIESLDLFDLDKLDEEERQLELVTYINEVISGFELVISKEEHQHILEEIISDLLGLGPLDVFLSDDEITDILVNDYDKIYIEKHGILHLTRIKFRDAIQLRNICTRIATRVGRRVDETSPICDARLADGSRVNIIFPPLAIRSPILTIRKFFKGKISLDDLSSFGSLTPQSAKVLALLTLCRSSILISGGTGSGKTTLLNALSNEISPRERIITVEDTVELQLQKPHVCQLETRPPNLEGVGEITQRDLVKNCLRMRPDRIILGEVRGSEAFDMLQAMNTGHAGSMSTIHANSPRDALARLEDMVTLTGFQLSSLNIQNKIASAIDLIVQIERQYDGSRKITQITEVVGMRENIITLQDIFLYVQTGEDASGQIQGSLTFSGFRPYLMARAKKYNLGEEFDKLLF